MFSFYSREVFLHWPTTEMESYTKTLYFDVLNEIQEFEYKQSVRGLLSLYFYVSSKDLRSEHKQLRSTISLFTLAWLLKSL